MTPATPDAKAPAGWLYTQPTITLERGAHLSLIRRLVVDPTGTALATIADDKTLRIWSADNGALQATIRMPAGPGTAGQPLSLAWGPDPPLLAVGGYMGTPGDQQILLFDAATHAMAARIQGLSGLVGVLDFAPGGQVLAAGLSHGGLRLFAPHADPAGTDAPAWREVARDPRFRQRISAIAFAPGGRMAVAAYDGVVALYTGPLLGGLRAAHVFACPNRLPFDIRFDPAGDRLAVGYDRELAVDILDGHTLARLPPPPLPHHAGGDCATVAWSADGQTLFAGGTHPPSRSPTSPPQKLVFAWDARGTAPARTLPASETTILGLVPLPGGDIAIAAADPWLGRLGPDAAPLWQHRRMQADVRGVAASLAVSPDGLVVDCGLEAFNQVPARFDVATLAFSVPPPADGRTKPPDQTSLAIAGWQNDDAPTLDGQPLPLDPHEIARSLAIHPDGQRFLLGADWSLTAYGPGRRRLWQRRTGTVMGVNITADGQLAIGALTDGTIRWYRMDDGIELLALMLFADRRNWVAWTPDGFFASSQAAFGVLRWHINHGEAAAAAAVPIADIQGAYRPELLPLILAERETLRALGRAQMIDYNRRVAQATGSRAAPGARLHLLAIGVGAYNQARAAQLTLAYAGADATDFATLIADSQRSLYGEVLPQCLADADATRAGVLRAFDAMGRSIAGGSGNDLAVIHFSGHGAMIDGRVYFLLHDVDASDAVGMRTQGSVSAEELQAELQRLARYGRVLVLLDACHSGGATASGEALAFDSGLLGAMLASDRITVITSSSKDEVSFEDPAWGHGAFTKVLLDAFTDPRADPDNDGLINATSLAHYVSTQVKALTGGRQNPGLELRYDTSIFARKM